MPMIDDLLTIQFTTSESRIPAIGTNKVAFLSGDADASLQGKLYTDAATVAADVTATDLTAQAGAQITAILAQGPRVGGVRLLVYDAAAPETPDDALDAGVAAGYLPLWDYVYIVPQTRTDAAIAAAATWADANARGKAVVMGQLSTVGIKSGTKPTAVAASAGSDLTAVYFDDSDTRTGIERITGWLARTDIEVQRPGCANIAPLGLSAYTAELTDAQYALVMGRESGQASCLASAPLYPAGARIVRRGYTVGGTLLEIELGVIILRGRITQAVANMALQRAQLQRPLRTTPGDATAIKSVVDGVLAAAVAGGYLVTGVPANSATGQPDLPNGFSTTVSFTGQTANVRGWLAYPGDVRFIDFDLTGVVI